MTESADEIVNLYLEALRDTPTPFDSFVSRASLPDEIDIENSHKDVEREVFRALKRTIRDRLARFVPIMGEAGSGKTHFYWYLRERQRIEKDWECVYIPSPPAPVRIALHIYSCIQDEIGRSLLAGVAQEFAQKFTKRVGFLRRKKYLADMATRTYPGLASDVVRVLVTYATDKKLKPLAERWLLAEDLNEEELKALGVSRIIEEDDTVIVTLRTLFKSYPKTILLYFDELEIPYRTRGPEAETRFFEYLKRLYNEIPQIIIVSACLTEMWDRVLQTADTAMRTRMEQPTHLQPFSKGDLERFYRESMKIYWETTQNIDPPSFNPLFPLTKDVFSQIIKQTHGNPRECKKYLRNYLENFISSYEEIKTHPNSQIAYEALKHATAIHSYESIDEIMTIELNPSSVLSGILDSILLRAKRADITLDIELEYSFFVKNNPQQIAARITIEGKHVGIEVPSVRSFDRSGGVAAYFSLHRLISAKKDVGIIDTGILIVPAGTTGKKFQSLCEQNKEDIIVVQLDGSAAEEIIRGGLKKKIVLSMKEIIEVIFPNLGFKHDEEEE